MGEETEVWMRALDLAGKEAESQCSPFSKELKSMAVCLWLEKFETGKSIGRLF